MAVHRIRRGWKGGLTAVAVAVLLTVEGVVFFIFTVVAVEIAKTP